MEQIENKQQDDLFNGTIEINSFNVNGLNNPLTKDPFQSEEKSWWVPTKNFLNKQTTT